jgi:hypothetical protein
MSPNPRNRTADTDRNSIELDEALEQKIRKLNALDDTLYRTVRNLLEPHQAAW